MKTTSHETPQTVLNAGGKYHINFDVEEKVREGINGNETYFEYNTAISDSLDRADVITAILRTQYSADDEFALLNNLNKGGQRYIDEYNAYQLFRAKAKEIAGTVV